MIKGVKAFSAVTVIGGAQILAANVERLDVIVRNLGPDVVFLYGADTALAFPILSGEIFDDDTSYDAWSALSSGSATLRVIEVTAE